MIRTNTGMLDPKQSASHERRSYAVGFVISLCLTALAFGALLSGLSATVTIVIIVVAALLQIVVHMHNFLHLSFSAGQSREDLLLVLFSVSLLAIMAGGTWYIMSDLSGRMHQTMTHDAQDHMPSGD
ncbi:cytochrome o ubiquinol oxidase subunit IV [Devosia sp.]|uniref:cytochrome o ubiquinol oxidase subunit IV n=1 Tax=Devosia sp. TaxID=1871048 RepID=UPI003A8CAC0B